MGSGSGRKDRAQQQLDLGDADNVIAFPGRQRAEPAERPAFAEAIDIILTALDDPEAHRSPLFADLAATAVVAMLRSAAGEPYALGPPDSPADIGPEPSERELSASSRQLVATLVDLAREVPMQWPDPPDSQSAIDAIHALSLIGGPLAEPARQALAEHGFQPGPLLGHFHTAEVISAYQIFYDHDDSFDLLFELRYPKPADGEPRPAYLTKLTTFHDHAADDPMVTAVQGADDITVILSRLTEVCNMPEPGAPTSYRPIDLATALTTLNRGLERFSTTVGAAAEPSGARVGSERLFMGGLIVRSGVDVDGTVALAEPPALNADRDGQADRSSSEPFNATGVPGALVERAGAIADEASCLAVDIFDEEFVTLVRRFTAACARHRDCPFGRGRLELWASGVVYAVAQLNEIPGGWGRLGMDATDLTDLLSGAHSTITAKARQLRQLLGLERYGFNDEYRHSSATIDLSSLAGLFAGSGLSGAALGALGRGGFDVGYGHHGGPGSLTAVGPTGIELEGDVGGDACFVLYVSLMGSKPAIWRRLRLPVGATFAQLHEALQLAFDWYDCHLHNFEIDGYRIGPRFDDGFGSGHDADEETTTLADVLTPGGQLMYLYDFGDNWEHGIIVEELQLDGASQEHGPWAVLGGAMAGPPEDCGGVWGYRELLEARRNRHHPRRSELADFLPPGFDPAYFDLYTINQAVRNRRW